jgi:hypothetical protein
MGTAAPKKRPMRSRRSGVKKATLVKSNLEILKKLAALFILVFLFACEAPYQITETIIKDSTGKETRVITKKYDNRTTVVPQASLNVVTHPGWDSFYGTPYYYTTPFYNYNPRVIITPRIVVPNNPSHFYRGGRH